MKKSLYSLSVQALFVFFLFQKISHPPEKILHTGDGDAVAQSPVPGGVRGSRKIRPAIGKTLEALAFQRCQAADEMGRVCRMEDQIGGVLVLSGALGAGGLILSKTVCPLAGVYSVLHDKGGVVAACTIGGGDGRGSFVGAGASAVQSVVLENQRFMAPCLRPKGGGLVVSAVYPLPSLAVEAKNAGTFPAQIDGFFSLIYVGEHPAWSSRASFS